MQGEYQKFYLKMKSRFYFNISISENIKNIFNLFFFKKNNFDLYLEKKMEILFKDSNFIFLTMEEQHYTKYYLKLKKIQKKGKY